METVLKSDKDIWLWKWEEEVSTSHEARHEGDETCLMENTGKSQGKSTEGKKNRSKGSGSRGEKCRERLQDPDEIKMSC